MFVDEVFLLVTVYMGGKYKKIKNYFYKLIIQFLNEFTYKVKTGC